MKDLWEHKTQYQRKDEHTPEEFYDRAGAELGKIVCISVGYCQQRYPKLQGYLFLRGN
jgi:hypothetical protein